jgi:hypothetical protein
MCPLLRSSLSLLLISASLMGCQAPPLTSPTPLSRSAAQRPGLVAPLSLDPAVPQGRVKRYRGLREQNVNGAATLHFEMRYPASFLAQATATASETYRSQILDYAAFVNFEVSVVGIGMPALYPASADTNHRLAASECSDMGCQVNASIADVPAGENRVALVQAYDAEGELIPGSTLATVFTLPEGDEDYVVQLSYRSNPLAALARELLAESADHLFLSQLNPVQAQQFFDQLMGVSGDFPNYSYTQHPALIQISNLLADLKAQQGDFSALTPDNPDYVYAGASVNGTVTGLVASDKVTLRLSDPVTGALIEQSNAGFAFENVPPGTWKLSVQAPPGYSVSGIPTALVVNAGARLENIDLVLTPALPVLTGVLMEETPVSDALRGDTLTLTGENFHPEASGNTVVVTNQTLPASAIEVISETELRVTLPTDLALGVTTVTVSVGSQQAVNTPDLRIVAAGPLNLEAANVTSTGFDLTWDTVPNAESYKVYRNDTLLTTVTAAMHTLSDLSPASLSGMEVVAVVDGLDSRRSALLNVYTLSSWSAWSALGPSTENVLAVTASVSTPDTVFFGSQAAGASLGGIWRCVNTDCVQKADASVADTVQALVVSPHNPTTIYAGSQANGVLKSTDNGENWVPANTGLTEAALNVRRLIMDPQRPGHIYAGTREDGVYMSIDAGANWQAINTHLPLNDFSLRDVGALSLYQPATGLPTLYAGTQGSGVFKTVAGDPEQVSWQSINDGLPELFGNVIFSQLDVTVMAGHPDKPAQQYGAGTGGCFVSFFCTPPGGPNGGYLPGLWRRIDPNNWLQLGHNGINEYDPQANSPNVSTGLGNMQVYDLVFDPLNGARMYVATGDGVYLSTDEGISWTKQDTGLLGTLRANVLAMHPLKLFMGTSKGLFLAN